MYIYIIHITIIYNKKKMILYFTCQNLALNVLNTPCKHVFVSQMFLNRI